MATQTKNDVKPLHILGAGAMGLVFARYLSHGYSVRLITREGAPTKYTYSNNQNQFTIDAHACTADECGEITTLLIATKAYQAVAAFKKISHALAPAARIIVAHNGMGSIEDIVPLLAPSQQLYFLTTSQGAYKTAPDTVLHKGEGPSQLGACNKAARHSLGAFYNELAQLLPKLERSDNINRVRWQKLLINIAINPLSAHHHVLNGALRAPEYAARVLALVNEAVSVANAEGMDVSLSQTLNKAYEVMSLTANNASSMLEDVRRRRKTEIEAICGYIVQKGKQHGIATPHNEYFLNTLR